jgi:hypothetical protein
MKKLTGTILIATLLLAHVCIIVATEESYIFSAADYQTEGANTETLNATSLNEIKAGGQPLLTNTAFRPGLFSVDEAFFAF